MNAMPLKDKPLSRRGFIGLVVKASLAGTALFGLGALGRFLSYQSGSDQPAFFDLGPTTGFPIGSRTPVTAIPALIIHDDGGYTALSLTCPHLGCTVNPTADGFACPCHGSRFYPDGSLRNGPASHPLPSLKVKVDETDHLILYKG
jgi:cytochrome b6-f complex iron-sulfur subunit